MISTSEPDHPDTEPDTHEMVVIHRTFRRESRLLAELIAAVEPGDATRARVLAAHLAWYRRGLHTHHQGEDELIWPLLLARAGTDIEIVRRMEHQHERVAQTLEQALTALPAWQDSAGAAGRDDLVAALVSHREVLVEHLDDEERHLLPLVSRHLTQSEWAALGDHFVASTPKSQLLVYLGAVLEDADASERAALLGAMPLLPRLIWHTAGHPIYSHRVRQVRAGRPWAPSRPLIRPG